MKFKFRRRRKIQKNITILRNGKVKKLKTPYTPQQAMKFRDGGNQN